MKPWSLALLLAASLPTLGLAGCQTVEGDGYRYSSVTYEEDYYDGPVYRDRVVVRRPPPPRDYGWHRPPRDGGWTAPPPRIDHRPPPRVDHRPPPRVDHRPPPRVDHRPPPPPQFDRRGPTPRFDRSPEPGAPLPWQPRSGH